MTGLEPATSGSQNQHSTTELHPGTRSIIRQDEAEVKVNCAAVIAVVPEKAHSASLRSRTKHIFQHKPQVCRALCQPSHKVGVPVRSERSVHSHSIPIFYELIL